MCTYPFYKYHAFKYLLYNIFGLKDVKEITVGWKPLWSASQKTKSSKFINEINCNV